MTPQVDRAVASGLTLLLVEDDVELASHLQGALRDLGHAVHHAGDGPQALALIGDVAFDAIVVDRGLPTISGMALVQLLRDRAFRNPILILTALGHTSDKVEGLEAGADDYLVKPAEPIEISARLHAMVRARLRHHDAADTIQLGDLVISPTKLRAWRDGRDLDLPRIEFKLLLELARNAGAVLTRPMLLQRVWNYDAEPTTNIVDAYIRRLRVKLMQFGGADPIVTARGAGYMLRAN